MSSFYIETYGCQMNIAESNAMEKLLFCAGWTKADFSDDSDLVIINTCAVRKSAENRIWGRLGEYKRIKSQHRQILVLTGCMAERLGEDIKKEAPQIDYVVPVNDKLKILEIIEKHEIPQTDAYEFTSSYWHEGDYSSFVPIMNGCNNFCSYCIVPYVRGREVSRPVSQVIDEVKFLDSKGVREVTLLGQNVNSYDFEGIKFPDLLRQVCRVCNNIRWVKFESPHPKDFSDELIEVIATEEKVAKHLHIPMQSANTRILKLMNRNYTGEQYLALIERIKKRIPDITFAVDVMVGFPSETEEEFEETLNAMHKVGYIEAYMYYWNPREGTRACSMDGQMSEHEKQQRLQILIDKQLVWVSEIKTERANGVHEVLVTGISRDNQDQYLGRNEHNEMVVFGSENALKAGDMVKVMFLSLKGNTYTGKAI